MDDKIIASYSECSLDTSRIFHSDERQARIESFDSNGLVVFDFEGNSLFEYMNDAKEDDFIPFMENYSFLKCNEDTVYLLAYLFDGRFSILAFNVKDYSTKKVLNLSERVANKYLPMAMTRKDNTWYILMNDMERLENDFTNASSEIFEMTNDSQLKKIGECCFSNRMRGNFNGSFSVPISFKNTYQNSCYIEL